MTDDERAARGLPPLDRERMQELIGLYSRIEIRNTAAFGRDSEQATMARHILDGLRDVRKQNP